MNCLAARHALSRWRSGQHMLVLPAMLALVFIPGQGWALTIAQYEHTVWGLEAGLDGQVREILPAPNGMLMLQTTRGYQVFDGVEFHDYRAGERTPFPDSADAFGQRSPDGAIYYIDPTTRRPMRKWQGKVEVVENPDNLDRWALFTFDGDGVGWYRGVGVIFRLEGLRVEMAGPSWGLPLNTFFSRPRIDARGRVWFVTEVGTLYTLPKGARKFAQHPNPLGKRGCPHNAFAPDGAMWCGNLQGLALINFEDGRPLSGRILSSAPHVNMLFDSRGGLWIQTLTGVKHAVDWREALVPGGLAALEADALSTKEGLSSNTIWTIAEDAAGNVWLGTGEALERFRPTRFVPVKLPRRSLGSAMLPNTDGSLWVGNFDGALMRMDNGRLQDVPAVKVITVIRRDHQGRVWVGADGLWRKEPGGEFTRVEIPDSESLPPFYQIGEDDAGGMWFQVGFSLMTWQNGQWSKPDGPTVPPSNRSGYSIVADSAKQLWFLGLDVYVLKGGSFRKITTPSYVDAIRWAVTAHVRGPRLWVGGQKGVGLFVGDEFRPLKLKGDIAKEISGIVETSKGDLWLHGLNKAIHVSADQVEAGLRGEAASAEVFDFRDGLQGSTDSSEPRPSLVEDAQGHLWFSTRRGLYWLDPGAAVAAARPPSTYIQSVAVENQVVPTAADLLVPPEPGQVAFKYSASALSVAEHVKFRYRVEGVDKDWQEAGARRTAYYTQLPPGRHRFQVAASNERGEWADTPTTLAFQVQPAWYQTLWFRALVGVVIAGLLGLAYLMRVAVVKARVRTRMREISAERERIARDLHDTLLQSMQGVILGFQGLANDLPAQHETRRSIEGQLDRADHLLGEARDRVRDLRTTGDDAVNLREAFELGASELAGEMRVDVTEEGKARALVPRVRDGIYLIGREAILNSVVHGKGDAIQVQLQHGRREFVLRVRDNGIGIAPEVLASGMRPGHFGLVGMRERAAQLGAVLRVSRLGDAGGTEVELKLPATRAYQTLSRPREGLKLSGLVAAPRAQRARN